MCGMLYPKFESDTMFPILEAMWFYSPYLQIMKYLGK